MQIAENEIIKAVLDTVGKFVERELADRVYELDKYPHSEYAADAVNGAADAGLLLLTAPESMGGIGTSPSSWALILEKIAYVDSGFAASLMANAMATQAILDHAKDFDINKLLEKAPFAYPLYLQIDNMDNYPIAYETESGIKLKGSVKMAANAPVAKTAVIAALKDGKPSLYLVQVPAEIKSAPIEMLGLKSCPVGNIALQNIESKDVTHLVEGYKALKALHGSFYSSATAILLSSLKASLDYAIEYGSERYQGGKNIAQHSLLQNMYATMAVEHSALRMAWLRTIETNANYDDCLALKILTSEHAIRATTDGVQLLGGYGYTTEYPQERRMRDARQASEILGSSVRQKLSLIKSRLGSLADGKPV